MTSLAPHSKSNQFRNFQMSNYRSDDVLGAAQLLGRRAKHSNLCLRRPSTPRYSSYDVLGAANHVCVLVTCLAPHLKFIMKLRRHSLQETSNVPHSDRNQNLSNRRYLKGDVLRAAQMYRKYRIKIRMTSLAPHSKSDQSRITTLFTTVDENTPAIVITLKATCFAARN